MGHRHRVVWLLGTFALLASSCIGQEQSAARKDFRFWVRDSGSPGQLSPQALEGERITLVSRPGHRTALGACTGNEAQFELWIAVGSRTGRIYDLAANGIQNASALVNVVAYESCFTADGAQWRQYTGDVEK